MKRLVLFGVIVLLPAIVVGISNKKVFPDSAWTANLMLLATCAAAAIFTWQSADATPKISRYAICADFVVCLILCGNLACHWILAREVAAATQGVVERHAEEDRDDKRAKERTDRELELKRAEGELAEKQARLQREERRRLAELPIRERRSAMTAPTPATGPIMAPMSFAAVTVSAPMKPRMTPDQVRESWWWTLTALAIAEVAAAILGGAILGGIWEWDRNKDGINDALQPKKAPRQ